MNDLDVKEIRKKLKVSQEKLAEMLGVVRKTIQNWENGAVIPQSKRVILLNLINEPATSTQRDETLSPENNNQIAELKKRITELEDTIKTLIATNKQLANTIDRLTSDPGMPGNAILVKTTKTTNGSIQPVIHVADLDNTKYQARKKRMILKK